MRNSSISPSRSALYLPASNLKAIEKARTLPCDIVILDLEDAVSPDAKDIARDQAYAACQARAFGDRELVVRVNGFETPWGLDDIVKLADARIDALLVPKVNCAADVWNYERHLRNWAPEIALWAMVETAQAIFNLGEIAAVAPETRLEALVMGTNDLAKEMRATVRERREPLLGSLGLAVLAARAFDLRILDGVFNDLSDSDGFAQQCRQGSEFGFDGKTLIHPTQIGTCNDAFSPSAQTLASAQAIVAAFDLPENRDKGAIRVDGRMVERLHLAGAVRDLAFADLIKKRQEAS